MLNLVATTDKLQLISSAAVSTDVHASYADLLAGAVTPGRQNTAITTATTTDVVAAPAASTVRNVKTLHIRNKHATSALDVTVVFDQNGTDYELHKETLRAGESLEYVEGIGFFVLQARTPDIITKKLAADQSNSTATTTEVTGLTQAVGVGSYLFDYRVIYQSGATTSGVKWSVNHTGTVTIFCYWIEMLSATITAADGIIDQDVALLQRGDRLALAAEYPAFRRTADRWVAERQRRARQGHGRRRRRVALRRYGECRCAVYHSWNHDGDRRREPRAVARVRSRGHLDR